MTETNIEEYIEEHGEIVVTPSGVSMWPMLRNRRDCVHFVKKDGRLKKFDLPIYKRSDGQLVMHRIMEIKDDSYVMCGDYQTVFEFGIKEEQIIAVAKGFFRDEKYISVEDAGYQKYCRIWCGSMARRKILLFLPKTAVKIRRKLKQWFLK